MCPSTLEMAKKQQQSFAAQVEKLSERFPADLGLSAVRRFIIERESKAVFSHPLWREFVKILGCNLTFRLAGQTQLICESDHIRFLGRELDRK